MTLLFLSIHVVDYSIVVGFDEDTHEIVVGIIDYLRQVIFSSFVFLAIAFLNLVTLP